MAISPTGLRYVGRTRKELLGYSNSLVLLIIPFEIRTLKKNNQGMIAYLITISEDLYEYTDLFNLGQSL
jgi:hypothetical protein